ncbi:MAG: hypothetical protein JWM11_2498 [Planctomycetaceae bacterium]|nr:hypothetical protein [Planctomycetaceae bacterium]
MDGVGMITGLTIHVNMGYVIYCNSFCFNELQLALCS